VKRYRAQFNLAQYQKVTSHNARRKDETDDWRNAVSTCAVFAAAAVSEDDVDDHIKRAVVFNFDMTAMVAQPGDKHCYIRPSTGGCARGDNNHGLNLVLKLISTVSAIGKSAPPLLLIRHDAGVECSELVSVKIPGMHPDRTSPGYV
jgi:hypothetical protein